MFLKLHLLAEVKLNGFRRNTRQASRYFSLSDSPSLYLSLSVCISVSPSPYLPIALSLSCSISLTFTCYLSLTLSQTPKVTQTEACTTLSNECFNSCRCNTASEGVCLKPSSVVVAAVSCLVIRGKIRSRNHAHLRMCPGLRIHARTWMSRAQCPRFPSGLLVWTV